MPFARKGSWYIMFRLMAEIYRSKWTRIVCRLVLASVFIYAAIGKILDPGGFADDVAAYRILPLSLVKTFAVILAWVELAGGLVVLSGIVVRYGALLLLGLNAMFIAAVASAMARGLHIECGCFNVCNTDSTVGLWLIMRDAGLVLLCLPLIFGNGRPVQRIIQRDN